MSKKLIYVVEDDEGIREVYEGALEDEYQLKNLVKKKKKTEKKPFPVMRTVQSRENSIHFYQSFCAGHSDGHAHFGGFF